MRLKRKQRMSIYYWLIDTVDSSVNVVDAYDNSELTLPTVSILETKTRGISYQLGSGEMNLTSWKIDVFAENKVQRDFLMDLIYEELECDIPVYNYDEGFPPSESPSQLGNLLVYEREARPLRAFEKITDKLYWRAVISFFTKYQAL